MGERVLGVLAGDRLVPGSLARWVRSAQIVLAADGGADHLLGIGRTPDATVGDLDSLSEGARGMLPNLVENGDQNSSDCDKLLEFAAEQGHRAITLVGCEGSRIDHMLAILHSAAKSALRVTLAYEFQLGFALRGPGCFHWEYAGGCSLLPLERCTGVSFGGVKWPLQGAELEARGLTSLSNVGTGRVTVEIGAGSAVLFIGFDGEPVWDAAP